MTVFVRKVEQCVMTGTALIGISKTLLFGFLKAVVSVCLRWSRFITSEFLASLLVSAVEFSYVLVRWALVETTESLCEAN